MSEQNLNHVGIIMDGNRRWALKRGLAVKAGHQEGVEALERVVRAAITAKVKHLTVYALSTENLKERAKTEIGDLFSLMRSGFITKLPTLKKAGVRVEFLGRINKLPLSVRTVLASAKKSLDNGKKLQLNIALNYGSREEIFQAVAVAQKKQLTGETEFSRLLYTKDIPDPELIIRTGGQKRLSNFLLWQAAYAELYFSDKLWPDFSEEDFLAAIEDYKRRKRNFGV